MEHTPQLSGFNLGGAFTKKATYLGRKPSRPHTPWMDEAYRNLGVARIPGSANNPKIMEFFVDAGKPQKHENVAYCAAFANACLERNGIRGTGTLLARDFLSWGMRVDTPRYGDIVVIKRGSKSWQGHVFFFIRMDDEFIYGIGGNQAGGAVTEGRYPRSRLLGFRRPSQMPTLVDKAPAKPANSKPALVAGGSILGWLSTWDGMGTVVLLSVLLMFAVWLIWPEPKRTATTVRKRKA